MRKMIFSDLNEQIDKKKTDVERALLQTRSPERLVRTRTRDQDEIKVLDKLCITRWKKAEKEGKIKYISDRVWYYEFD